MQEEVTQKTIALYVKVGKGAARLTEQALQKAIQKFLEQKSKAPHGKQTMRQLMKQNAGVSNIEITDSNIKAFESTAKKYNILCFSVVISNCNLHFSEDAPHNSNSRRIKSEYYPPD